MSGQQKFRLEYEGICPICEKQTTFRADGPWLRDTLKCFSCPNGSVPRERALAMVLNEMIPDWRNLRIHESSPANRGISAKLRAEAKNYTPTQFYQGLKRGVKQGDFYNEDLQCQTFDDEQFDLFVSLDVLEHIPEPHLAIKEIWRTLKVGGVMLCTFPVRRDVSKAMEYRVKQDSSGALQYVKEPVYHGNPINSKGALVTVDYGYDVHNYIAACADFDVRVYRFDDRTHGVLGGFTEVFYCKKAVVDRHKAAYPIAVGRKADDAAESGEVGPQ